MINEHIWLGLYTIIELIGYWCIYVLILNTGANKKWWRYPAYITFALVIQLGLYTVLNDLTTACIIPVILGILIPFTLIEKKKTSYVLVYFAIISITSIVQSIADILLYNLVGNEIFYMDTFSIYKLFSHSFVILLCLIYGSLKKLLRFTLKKIKLGKIQYINLAIGLLCCVVFIVYNIIYICRGNTNPAIEFLLTWAGVLVCIILLALSIIQGILLSKNAEYKEKQLQYDYYLKLQEQNISALIERDAQLRQFRHDMHGHITAIRAIAENCNNQELTEYIENTINKSAIFKLEHYTDNVAIDAIISDMQEKMEINEIKFTHTCNILIDNSVEIYDICTIMYNTLKNAIEACEQLEASKRYISLQMHNIANKMYIIIRNSCNITEDIENIEQLASAKADKVNHGIGSHNIKEAVERNGGVVKFSVKNSIFEVSIML